MAARPRPASAQARQQRSRQQLRVGLVAVAVLAVIAIVVLNGRSGDGTEDAASGREVADNPLARRQADDPMAMGDLDAPVVMVEVLDVRCPFCALFATTTLPDLIERYVDTGKVRYEIIDVSYFGDESTDGAIAARAAGEQGRYHEYLQALYEAAPERGRLDLDRAKIVDFATQVGVPDLARFEADLDRPELRQAVDTSTLNAQRMGMSSVPRFVIGTSTFSGAQPIETFIQVIDDELARAGS